MDITKIIVSIIGLLLALAEVFLIPWLKGRVDAQKMDRFLTLVDIAVASAEKIAENYGYNGEWKKAYVEEYLINRSFNFDRETINNAIESAVIILNNELRN